MPNSILPGFIKGKNRKGEIIHINLALIIHIKPVADSNFCNILMGHKEKEFPIEFPGELLSELKKWESGEK